MSHLCLNSNTTLLVLLTSLDFCRSMRFLLTIFKQCVYSLASSKTVIPKTFFVALFSFMFYHTIQLRNIYEKFALFFFSLLKAKGTPAMKNVQKIAGNGRKMVIL